MSKRIVVLTLALLVTLATAVSAAEPKAKSSGTKKAAAVTEKAPRLTIVEPVKDFGQVAKGEKLDWSFEVRNTGTSDLEIISAKPACGCTVAEYDKVIKSGQSGKIQAHVDTTAFAGPIAKTVTIETNDPNNPAATLTIHAIVKPYVEAFPTGFVRYQLLQGDADVQSVTLFSEEEEPFEIVKIETPGDWVKVTPVKIDDPSQKVQAGRPGQNQYRLEVTVGGPDSKVGPLAERIRIVTNSKHQPDYFLSLSGVIRPAFNVDPIGVNFGEITTTDPSATRSVIIKSNNLKAPESFTVSNVQSSTSAVTASVKPTANKGEYEVTLQVVKDTKPGEIDGNVIVQTNDKSNPTVTVPFKGMIKSPQASK